MEYRTISSNDWSSLYANAINVYLDGSINGRDVNNGGGVQTSQKDILIC